MNWTKKEYAVYQQREREGAYQQHLLDEEPALTGRAETARPCPSTGYIITLPYPPSVNHYWGTVDDYWHVREAGKQYRRDVWVLWHSVPRVPPPITGRLDVHVQVFPPDRKRRDLDNLGKALLDALQLAGAYLDDAQIDRLCFRRRDIARPGYVIVTLTELSKGEPT